MCYAIPGKVLDISNDVAMIDYFGERKEAIVDAGNIRVGDYVFAQGGLIVGTLKEDEAHGILEGWKEAFVAAARFPNVFCKLSGMVTEADWKGWTPADLRPYVQLALESFGPDRLMFGSDWPVSLLAAPYGRVVDGLVEALGPITAAERGKIFGGTAARFYGLKV